MRSTLGLADFTVSPEEADLVVATTEQAWPAVTMAVGRSASWREPLAAACQLGRRRHPRRRPPRRNDLRKQRRRGNLAATRVAPAAPAALQAISKDLIYAATGEAVLTSTDGGRSFTFPSGWLVRRAASGSTSRSSAASPCL